MERVHGICTLGELLDRLQIVFVGKFPDIICHLYKFHVGKPGKILEDERHILKNKLTVLGIRTWRSFPLFLLDALKLLLLSTFYLFPIIRRRLIIGKSRKGKQTQ